MFIKSHFDSHAGERLELTPPINLMRSVNTDFQRGELEWGGRNIYFDHYSCGLEVKELKLPK